MLDQPASPSQPERRTSARFLHASGAEGARSRLPPQFDLYLAPTPVVYPEQGPIAAYVTTPWVTPVSPAPPQDLVRAFKSIMRVTPIPDQTVHVTKPYMDQRYLRIVPMVLGRARVLGLEMDRPEERTVFIRKPPKMNPDTGDADAIRGGDVVVLGFCLPVPASAPPRYCEMVADVARVATEHLVLWPRFVREEEGRWVGLIDFSAGGVKIAVDTDLMAFLSAGTEPQPSPEDPLAAIRGCGLRLNFYISRSSVYGADMYRTDLPQKVSLLGRILRADLAVSDQGLRVTTFGLKFVYDPVEFSIKTYAFDRWARIPEARQSQHFSEVHSAMSGRKRTTLPDSELFERAKKLFERSILRRRANARWLIKTTLQLADQKRLEIESGRSPTDAQEPEDLQ